MGGGAEKGRRGAARRVRRPSRLSDDVDAPVDAPTPPPGPAFRDGDEGKLFPRSSRRF